jgi:ABC-type sugar transport system ATPase subunit
MIEAAAHPAFTLEARGISKAYGHVQALDGVNLGMIEGEILALVGDNGAGKSTLVKILAGVLRPDSGELLVSGQKVELRNPADAVRNGVATVYQDLALVDSRDVAANLFLGREFRRGPFVDAKRCNEEAVVALRMLGAAVPSVRTIVGLLSGGQRQAVAIGRAVAQGSHTLLLDEPTAALGVAEAGKVIKLLGELKASGRTILMISHNLNHVMQLADRIAVLQLGRLVGIRLARETTPEEIVQLIMFGPSAGGSGEA